eukprot:Hpha_TRINITY_DN16595_c2_g2::TRINITY_DN16595_c2_g2_i1::g.132699::m.132699
MSLFSFLRKDWVSVAGQVEHDSVETHPPSNILSLATYYFGPAKGTHGLSQGSTQGRNPKTLWECLEQWLHYKPYGREHEDSMWNLGHRTIEEAPPFWVIHLSRNKHGAGKDNRFISFPLFFSVGRYDPPPPEGRRWYVLRGVVKHTGGAANGHYVAYCNR